MNAVNFSDLGHGSRLGWVLQGIDCLAVAFAGWLLLFMMSGSASYFYHPRSLGIVRQNRAVALSYYSCAPLAWMFVPAILLGIAVGLESIRDPFIERFSNSFLVLAGGAGTAILLWWGILILRIMRYTVHCGSKREFVVAVCFPISWVLLVLIAALIPLSVIYISLVIMSLR